MNNIRVEYFPFWEAIKFTDDSTILENPESGLSLTDLFWKIGSWADQYLYLGQTSFIVNAEYVDTNKIYYELVDAEQQPMKVSALKVASYALSLFTLPALALIAKVIFKIYLNTYLTMTRASPNTVVAEKQFGKTKIVLLSGSLVNETTDAIVNAANDRLAAGGGVCGVIATHAGMGVFKECKQILKTRKIKSIKDGEAVLTSAGNLSSNNRAIVHAVGPYYDDKVKDNAENSAKALEEAYTNSLKLITSSQYDPNLMSTELEDFKPMYSIAFPSISTGIFNYPLKEAPKVAFKAVIDFIEKNPDALEEVRFVFLPIDKDPQKTLTYYQKAFERLDKEESDDEDSLKIEKDESEVSEEPDADKDIDIRQAESVQKQPDTDTDKDLQKKPTEIDNKS